MYQLGVNLNLTISSAQEIITCEYSVGNDLFFKSEQFFSHKSNGNNYTIIDFSN